MKKNENKNQKKELLQRQVQTPHLEELLILLKRVPKKGPNLELNLSMFGGRVSDLSQTK